MRRIAEDERKLGHQSLELGGDTFDVLMPSLSPVIGTMTIVVTTEYRREDDAWWQARDVRISGVQGRDERGDEACAGR